VLTGVNGGLAQLGPLRCSIDENFWASARSVKHGVSATSPQFADVRFPPDSLQPIGLFCSRGARETLERQRQQAVSVAFITFKSPWGRQKTEMPALRAFWFLAPRG